MHPAKSRRKEQNAAQEMQGLQRERPGEEGRQADTLQTRYLPEIIIEA
jgi:hypothetical protein